MKKVDFAKVQPGDVVEVPRTQFSQQRWGWNGWLFSEAVVLEKGKGHKTGRPVIKVEMRMPGNKTNAYTTRETIFAAEHVFQTAKCDIARRWLEKEGYTPDQDLDQFIEDEHIVGADWIRFLNDRGKLYEAKEA